MQTVKNTFDKNLAHVVRLSPRYPKLGEETFLWANFYKEIDWCTKNCKGQTDVRLFKHCTEQGDDWLVAEDGENSVFFAFEYHDEALVFRIKFSN